jgi:hypothetical protein
MWNYPDMSLYKIMILTAIKTDTTRTAKKLAQRRNPLTGALLSTLQNSL